MWVCLGGQYGCYALGCGYRVSAGPIFVVCDGSGDAGHHTPTFLLFEGSKVLVSP